MSSDTPDYNEFENDPAEFGKRRPGRPRKVGRPKSRGKSHRKSRGKSHMKLHMKSHRKNRRGNICRLRSTKKQCGERPDCGWRKRVGCVKRKGSLKGVKYEGPIRGYA